VVLACWVAAAACPIVPARVAVAAWTMEAVCDAAAAWACCAICWASPVEVEADTPAMLIMVPPGFEESFPTLQQKRKSGLNTNWRKG
jgi:hypothetical protein